MIAHLTQGGVVRWFGNQALEDLYIEFWYTSGSTPIPKFRNLYTTTPLHAYTITAAAVSHRNTFFFIFQVFTPPISWPALFTASPVAEPPAPRIPSHSAVLSMRTTVMDTIEAWSIA